MTGAESKPLDAKRAFRVAVAGAGPAGLASAIFFSGQEGVEVQLFEQARELREIGAVRFLLFLLLQILPLWFHSNELLTIQGIQLHHNIFRVLGLLDARDGIETSSLTTNQEPVFQQRYVS